MLELKITRTSRLSRYWENEIRTSIPLDIVDEFNLRGQLMEQNYLLSYKIIKFKNFLILNSKELPRDEIVQINKFFSTSEMVQRYENVKIWVNKMQNHYTLKFNPATSLFLHLEPDNLIGYATLKIDNLKFLVISGDLKIRLNDNNQD
ncbi:MAG: hypothetical protein ACFFD2_00595 [Promethearchaeota archaeon]